jgi:cysteine desulfurase/selenocysteine lyase
MAIKGLVDPYLKGHAICTHIDHNSILRPLRAMEERGWVATTRVPVDNITGMVDPDDIRRAIRPDTRLIAITHVSNVTGTIQPIREIGLIAREAGIPFIVDAAQSAGHVPIDLSELGVDLLAAPGHKGLLGPLGTGFLYVRPGIEKRLATIKEGGTGSVSELDRQPDFMPDKYEPGSHNAIGIIGLSEGLKWIGERSVQALHDHDQQLIGVFLEGVREIEGLTCYGPRGRRNRVGVFSVRIDGYEPHELSAILESSFGILTRSGIHCAPLAHETIGTASLGGTTRLSFGPFVSPEDVTFAVNALTEIAAERIGFIPS